MSCLSGVINLGSVTCVSSLVSRLLNKGNVKVTLVQALRLCTGRRPIVGVEV
jgi:hypothetical protein